jgi:hypothetical protein
MPMPRDRAERALVEALNKDGLTHLRSGASVGLSSTRRFYKDFRNLRLAIVAKNREIRKQRIRVIANTPKLSQESDENDRKWNPGVKHRSCLAVDYRLVE